jgi:hypothetical protein
MVEEKELCEQRMVVAKPRLETSFASSAQRIQAHLAAASETLLADLVPRKQPTIIKPKFYAQRA